MTGSVEGIAMIENIMEHIAKITGKDPLKVRYANMHPEHKESLNPMIDQLLENADYEMRKIAVDSFNNVRMLEFLWFIVYIKWNINLSSSVIFIGESMEKERNSFAAFYVSLRCLGTVSRTCFNLRPRWHSLNYSRRNWVRPRN